MPSALEKLNLQTLTLQTLTGRRTMVFARARSSIKVDIESTTPASAEVRLR